MTHSFNEISKGRVYQLYKEGKLIMANQLTKKPLKIALEHFVKVFLYAGLSAFIPAIVSWLEQDPRWLGLAPIINAALYSAKRYLDEKAKVEGALK